jgi:hypothetical protein
MRERENEREKKKKKAGKNERKPQKNDGTSSISS